MGKIDDNEIKVCGSHQDYPVPLIWTYAWSGYEYWCPFCGNHEEMMGAGKNIKESEELLTRVIRYQVASEDYLHAQSVSVCSGMEWEGRQIHPDELPQQEKDRLAEIRKTGWTYEVKAEDLKIDQAKVDTERQRQQEEEKQESENE